MTDTIPAAATPTGGQPDRYAGPETPSAGGQLLRSLSLAGDKAPAGERFLLLLFSGVRIAAVVAFAVILLTGSHELTLNRLVVGFAVVLLAESAALLAICWRQGTVTGRWCVADTSFCASVMIVGVLVTARGETESWNQLMSPFALVTFTGLGMCRARTKTIAAAAVALAGTFIATAHIYHVPYSTAAYFLVLTVVARAFARNVRLSEQALNAARRVVLEKARQLTREQERIRHGRILHDRVLQTLDNLVRSGAVRDEQLGAEVAGEAAWLRMLLANPDSVPEASADLVVRLHDIANRKTAGGLVVEVNAAGLSTTTDVPVTTVDALARATEEAITNVGKHAGTARALVRAVRTADHLTVTILDHGRGFEPAESTPGFGLAQSVRARIEEVGGRAVIDSVPGEGTNVTLTAPTPLPRARQRLPQPAAAPVAPPRRPSPSRPDASGRPGRIITEHARAVAAAGIVLVLAVGATVVTGLATGPGTDQGSGPADHPGRPGEPAIHRSAAAAPSTLPTSPALAADVLVWSSGRDGNRNNIATAHVDGAPDLRQLTRTTGSSKRPVVSPDRRTVVYLRQDLGALWVMAADGSGQRPLLRSARARSTRIAVDARPSWSPDGRHVVVPVTGPRAIDLYVLGVDDGTVRRIPTPGLPQVGDPAWSPDGAWITYWASTDPTGGALYKTSADGRHEPVQLTHSRPGTDAGPAWSPDSRRIAFRRGADDRARDVWVMDADGSNQRRLTFTPGADQDPTWSPDGTRIAFSSERNGNREIYIMRATGKGIRRFTINRLWDSAPSW